jgi:hypothetical protein
MLITNLHRNLGGRIVHDNPNDTRGGIPAFADCARHRNMAGFAEGDKMVVGRLVGYTIGRVVDV